MPLPTFPNQLTEKYLTDTAQQINSLPEGDQLIAVRDFFNQLVTARQQGRISRETACYSMADVMFVPSVQSQEEYLDICLAAGKLELPDYHIAGDPEELWQKLVKQIKALSLEKEKTI